MIKRLAPVLFFVILPVALPAQFDTSFIKKNIRHCADSLTLGFRTKNWDLFTRYSYPAMVASLGGTNAFSQYIAQQFAQVPASAWKKYETGDILQVIRAGRDYQAIIELRTTLEWEGKLIRSVSHLVGSSWDGGMFWTFFDSQGEERAARQIMPDLDPRLQIPRRDETREPLSRPAGKSNH